MNELTISLSWGNLQKKLHTRWGRRSLSSSSVYFVRLLTGLQFQSRVKNHSSIGKRKENTAQETTPKPFRWPWRCHNFPHFIEPCAEHGRRSPRRIRTNERKSTRKKGTRRWLQYWQKTGRRTGLRTSTSSSSACRYVGELQNRRGASEAQD